MLKSKKFPASRTALVNGLKISLFFALLAFGFTACQDSGVSPKVDVSSKKPPREPDFGRFSTTEDSTNSNRPPREPDYGG